MLRIQKNPLRWLLLHLFQDIKANEKSPTFMAELWRLRPLGM